MAKTDGGDELQLKLVEMQLAMQKSGERGLIVLEGRDSAGKDGTIKALTEHLSVRSTRVIALPKPNDREQSQWYLQRYVAHLPAASEIVIFNRSWYNRAGVEVVNGFSTGAEQAQFLRDVPRFEAMLVESGIKLIKLWLDISRAEQEERLAERASNPLKMLKRSPLDAVATAKWDAYSAARDAMLTATSTDAAPWVCVRADKKKRAHEAVIEHVLRVLAPGSHPDKPDKDVLFRFDEAALTDGRLER